MSVSAVLILIAVILFAIATFGGSVAGISLVPLGLCFFAAGHLKA